MKAQIDALTKESNRRQALAVSLAMVGVVFLGLYFGKK